MDVSALIVHFQTPDFLDVAVRSFVRHFPTIPLYVVDNGSADEPSKALLTAFERELKTVEVLRLEKNLFHGPAMDFALRRATSRYVLVLDSDTETRDAAFLGGMVSALEATPNGYAAGQIVHVDKRGFVGGMIPVPTSWHMLLRRDLYVTLPPFLHHGLPVLHNMREAQRRGLVCVSYPVWESVHHHGRGTVTRYGYKLGWRSRWDYLMHRLGL